MDLKEIRQLIKMVETADMSEFEIEENDLKIRIAKNSEHIVNAIQTAPVSSVAPANAAQVPSPVQSSAESIPSAPTQKDNVVEVKSPMVGTFYRSPSPDSDPYTEIGKSVKVGDVLCIVEAMKLMNEIESEVNGKVVEILVDNAQPVEYNQVLFLVEKQ